MDDGQAEDEPTGTLTPEQTRAALERTGFTHLHGALHASYRLPDFRAAAALVARIGEEAERAGHHPDLGLGWGRVDVELSSHDVGGVSTRDLEMAAAIDDLAGAAGAERAERPPRDWTIAIDAMRAADVSDFWRAVMDYDEVTDDDGDISLVDPRGRGPDVWFQQMDAPRPQRNRIHIDVYVPEDEAPRRVAAVVEAGGRLVTDEYAPSWWVLADAEGNEACICTSSS